MTSARILIVSEDRNRGPDLQAALTAAGYEVFNRPMPFSGALGQLAELKPDLVLMDMGMRGKVDGVQAADIIQSQLDIPVIYMMPTCGTGQVTLQRSRATEPFGYIFDPLDSKQMASTIEVALLRNRLEREIKESRQWLSTVL